MSKMTCFIGLIIATGLAGCTKTYTESWKIVSESAVDYAYIKPDADFSVYRRLYPEPFEIYYPDEVGKPDPADLERIRAVFRDAFREAVGDAYEIVDAPGRDVLKVRASLIDLRTNIPLGKVNVGSQLAGAVKAGHLTLLMEMIDSRSDETLARAADEEKPDYSTIAYDDDWAAVEAAAVRWAGLFRNFLDNYLAQS